MGKIKVIRIVDIPFMNLKFNMLYSTNFHLISDKTHNPVTNEKKSTLLKLMVLLACRGSGAPFVPSRVNDNSRRSGDLSDGAKKG